MEFCKTKSRTEQAKYILGNSRNPLYNRAMLAIDILIFAIIAIFLCIRLYQVLGGRNGNEPPPQDTGWHRQITRPTQNRAETVHDMTVIGQKPPPDPGADNPLSAALAQIKSADRQFAEGHFLRGARAAFELIVKAYSHEDIKTLRELCDPAVYDLYARFIDERKARGENMDTTLVRVRDPQIAGARIAGTDIFIDVQFQSEQINFTRNADGRVIDGDPDRIFDVNEIWTFRRDTAQASSLWFLHATKVPV